MTDRYRDADLRHLWHPYTDITAFEREPYACIERAEGLFLYTATGHRMYDGIASWWAVSLGHSHPRIVAAIREQAGVLQHAILGNLSHAKAVELAERLAAIAPEGLEHVYFACDGSSAAEAALKMAVQYWQNVGRPEKFKFIGIEEGYHGDTLGAIGVGFTSWFQEPFKDIVLPAYRAPSPHCTWSPGDDSRDLHALDQSFAEMKRLVRQRHHEIAAITVEPLCQGSAGIRIHHPDYLRRLRKLCDGYDILLIADEIATGLGRTGKRWACDQAGIAPDILCVGKALTGGTLPMSAAIASNRIYDSFRKKGVRFWDGHTFCGNPITAAAALAALDVYEEEGIPERCGPAIEAMAKGFAQIGRRDSVAYFRTLGMIGMCAIKESAGGAVFARKVSLKAMELGLYIRSLGDVIYLWPPLTATAADLRAMFALLEGALEESGG